MVDVKKAVPTFDAAFEGVKEATLSTFATDDSASVQATLYKMTQIILGKFKDIDDVSYALPNKHYFQIDMSNRPRKGKLMAGYIGTKNTGPYAEVYRPEAYPAGKSYFGRKLILGYITATVSRKTKSVLWDLCIIRPRTYWPLESITFILDEIALFKESINMKQHNL